MNTSQTIGLSRSDLSTLTDSSYPESHNIYDLILLIGIWIELGPSTCEFDALSLSHNPSPTELHERALLKETYGSVEIPSFPHS